VLARFAIPRRIILEKIPLVLLAAAMCVATMLSQRSALHAADNIGLSTRLGNAVVSVVAYALQLFYPANLAVYVPYPDGGWPAGTIALASAVLVVISAAVFYSRKKQPWLLVGWLWYLVMLLPVIGLIQVGAQARADRYTYLPEIGLCLALTWAISEITVSWPSRRFALGTAAALVIAALTVKARAQTACWHDSESLWKNALDCTTHNAVAESNLAIHLLHRGRLDEAMTHSKAALEIQPNYPEAENCLGYALFQSGRVEDAVFHYQTALKINPDFASSHINLGMALLQLNRPEEAATELKTALKFQPDSADAHSNLGVARLRTGHAAEAVAEYQAALDLDPNMVGANNNLAWLLATNPDAAIRDGRRAVPLAERANKLSAGNLVILRTLAAAYAEAGRFPEAIEVGGQALQLATTQNRPAWIKVLNSDLSLYRAGQPLHDAGQ
jgi:protein O-mannosyl-transferase